MRARTVLLAFLLVAPCIAPAAASVPPERGAGGRAGDDSIEWVNPTPTGSGLRGIAWSDGAAPAMIVGRAGTAMRYAPFSDPNFALLQTGVSENLNAVAVRPGGAGALVVGDAGTVLVYDGASFQSLASGTLTDLNDVAWYPDGSGAMIVGDTGTVLAYDGSSLSKVNATTRLNLLSVAWGKGNGQALAVGASGVAALVNRSSFTLTESGVSADLYDVDYTPDGTAATAVGDSVAVGYDGRAFGPALNAAFQVFRAVSWKPDGSSALIVGQDNDLFRASVYTLEGPVLTKVTTNITVTMYDVLWEPGAPMALVVGSGGLVAELSAGSFDVLSSAQMYQMQSAGWRSDGSYALLAGSSGYLARYNGTALSQVPTGLSAELDALAWHPSGEYALACGRDGTVLRYTHSNSSVEVLPTGLPLSVNFTAVSWKPDGSYALLTGESGRIVKFNGTGFALQQPLGLVAVNYLDIAWKPDGAYALIAGVSGNILKYDERALPPPLDFCVTKVGGAPQYSFFHVSWARTGARSDALVSGTGGSLYLVNATGIALQATGTKNALYAVDWMPQSGYAMVAGAGGKLLQYVGYGCLQPVSGTDVSFMDVAWEPAGAYALVLGQSGAVLKYTWARRDAPKAVISSPRQDAVFEPGATIMLDGSNSTPTFGEALVLEWRSNLTGALGTGAQILKVLSAGRHTITLFANDSRGGTGSASVSILVKAPNRAPVIVLDSPAEGAVFNDTDGVRFDASRSFDPDGDPLAFHWFSGRAGFLGNAPAFTSTLNIGAHTITVWLDDSMGYNVSRSVSINVVQFNNPPEPVLSSPIAAGIYNNRDSILFDASPSTDPDGDLLFFHWTSNLSGYLGSTGRFTRVLASGAHHITVWADDSRGGNRSASVNITVGIANEPPVLSVDSPAAGATLSGVAELSGVATDPEGAAVTVFVQIDDDGWTPATGNGTWNFTLDTTVLPNGRHTLRVKASDGPLESDPVTLVFTVHNAGWGWSVAVSFPLDGTTVHGNVRIEGTASRTGSAITQVEARIDDGDWVVAGGAAQWAYEWKSGAARNGVHRISIRAFDGTDYSPEVNITLKLSNPPAPAATLPVLGMVLIPVAVVALVVAVRALRGRGKDRRPREEEE